MVEFWFAKFTGQIMVNNMVVSVPISSIVGRINRIGKYRIDRI